LGRILAARPQSPLCEETEMSTGGHDLDDHAKEGYKRVRAEADAARLANDPAAAKPGLFARWRTRRYRHAAEQLEAKARSHETLKDYNPPGNQGGIH
jgi:hypothetical protein